MKKGSIFRKLIASYIVFAMTAVVIVIGVSLASVILAVESSNNMEFPGLAVDDSGNIQDPASVQQLGGWVEELDENYRVCEVYGEKQTDTVQYTPEFLLEWTDQRTGNDAFYLYWQKKENGYYLIYYPVDMYSVTYTFNASSLVFMAPDIGRWAGMVMLVLLLADIVLVSLYISRIIHRPLRNLISGMKRVEQGEECVELSMQTEREFVEIQRAFNRMTEKLQEQRAENERMSQNRQRMLLELSHDIRTPIATIKSSAFALQEGMVSNENLNQYYRTIVLKADRVNQMAEDLFTMLKMESADYCIEFQKIDIAELARRVCAEYYEEITEAGFDFVIDIPEKAVCINGDEKLMVRVIGNLLTNAKKYNQTGKQIQAGMRDGRSHVCLWVKDDGLPVGAELRDIMFAAFVRGESTRSTKGGTGLGLAIAKAVVEKHGGELSYQEEDGNRFEMRIPKVFY
ncbi:MAG: HAMP domain-containing histidine kinase [Lachnospiraceae bacterium]|nr:HAMP domain-containing histidine kinase [Lachnospiraceae bacterium]